ncbi:flagellar motor protein PomA [Colwellia sp. 4_MG-2023]|uniref:flagellar motor protein PomA n=1 Tax=unclassified Colwellia TaxID=196834 RepID=UPI001C08A0CC|nr:MULTISPECIES: flagellar motor protein PomA [unclassified Colwellia]MBU2923251.1 flagellar motor protein PomA [Colwellia sp. C2M11]MDO6486654.1 flagellar motor protein PomA [Colwellia sp. 6_MG-2023]MDO6506723.1 flagellar motor protein PomA [Colwellia sp. 5_MG-2023]MDO6555549.1 flagellar motor protein PomA [Colwellia sp. 4_MG-2023]MDO6651320.1 flagellar motor protein PomA [Colwellia sp. 3_MG-2023]
MDLATLIGILGAIAFLVMAMVLSGDITMFADTQSVLIVFGGSLFIVLSNYSIAQFFGIGKIIAKAFIFKLEKPEELIEKAVDMADAARKGGFLALEEAEITNNFMQKGVDMLVDGHDADVVRATLQKDINLTTERHEKGAGMLTALADVAPAMGMIGTLIGLVAMLANMDDPKSIGPAMAVALLTTLYGAFLANVIAIPLATKLKLRMEEEKMNQELILDAVLGIQDGQNPRVIEGLLKNYLAEGKRQTNTTDDE